MHKSFYLVYLVVCVLFNVVAIVYQFALKNELKGGKNKLRVVLYLSIGTSVAGMAHAIAVYCENRAGPGGLFMYSLFIAFTCSWGGVLSKHCNSGENINNTNTRYAHRKDVVC